MSSDLIEYLIKDLIKSSILKDLQAEFKEDQSRIRVRKSTQKWIKSIKKWIKID